MTLVPHLLLHPAGLMKLLLLQLLVVVLKAMLCFSSTVGHKLEAHSCTVACAGCFFRGRQELRTVRIAADPRRPTRRQHSSSSAEPKAPPTIIMLHPYLLHSAQQGWS